MTDVCFHATLSFITTLAVGSGFGAVALWKCQIVIFEPGFRRNGLLWRRRQPASQRSEQLLPAPITVTSTAISSAPLLLRTPHTHWRQTKHTAVVRVESMGCFLQRVPSVQSALGCGFVCVFVGVFPLCCLSLWLISVSPSVPVANKRDTRSIEEAMNEIRAKKRQKKGEEDTGASSTSECGCVWVCVGMRECECV